MTSIEHREATRWLDALATQTGAFQVVDASAQPPEDQKADRPSIDIIPQRENAPIRLDLIVRQTLTPRQALSLVNGLQSDNVIPLLCCPYVSPRVAEICHQAKLNYLDKAGNCRIAVPGVFLEIRGRLNPTPDTRSIGNPFAARSSRVVRLLMEHPLQTWQVQELAHTAGVSIGLVSKVKQALLDQGYIVAHGRGLVVRDYDALLRDWSAAYQHKAERHSFYVMAPQDQLEKQIVEWCQDQNVHYALSSFSAAWRLAPMVRYNQTSLYILGDDRRDLFSAFIQAFDAKRADSGSNVLLGLTDDPWVFYEAHEVDQLKVTSPLQTYLDLHGSAGRGEEAANAIYQAWLGSKTKTDGRHKAGE